MVQPCHSDVVEFVVTALRIHRNTCKERLSALRLTAGRAEHRQRVLDVLRAVREDLTAVKAGDTDLAESILRGMHDSFAGPPADRPQFESGASSRSASQLREEHAELLREHRGWLSTQGESYHLKSWLDHLAQDHCAEGAIWEAVSRRWLQAHVDAIEPAEDERGRGLDFRCETRGLVFQVEATCVTIDSAADHTGLLDLDLRGQFHGLLTERVCEKVDGKSGQVAAHQSAPTVLMIGTLHRTASWLATGERLARDLLTGAPLIAHRVSTRRQVAEPDRAPFAATELHGSPFIVADGPDDDRFGARNRSLAAVLVCTDRTAREHDPMGRPACFGVLHPQPLRTFDPLRGLPGVPFLALAEGWRQGQFLPQAVHCRPAERRAYTGR